MKVLVISDDVGNATQLHAALNDHRAITECVTRPWRILAESNDALRSQFKMVFAVIDKDSTNGKQQLLGVRNFFDSFVVAVGYADSSEDVIRLLHQGADDFLDIRRDLSTQLAEVILSARTRVGIEANPQNVISVLGATGGSGTSTMAVNIAASIAKSKGRCGLFDFVKQQGDLARLLGISPNHSLQSLCSGSTSVDSNMLERSMTKHTSGIELLASDGMIEQRGELDQAVHSHMIGLAMEKYDDIVIDLGSSRELLDWTGVLQQVDSIVVPFRLDFSSVCRTRNVLDFFSKHRIDERVVTLVCNRFGMSSQLDKKQAEKILGRPIGETIPEEIALANLSVNCGVPAVIEVPRSRFSRSMNQLTQSLLEKIVTSNLQASDFPVTERKRGLARRGIDRLKQTLGCFYL